VARVFLSYRRENDAPNDRVRNLGERLEQAGLTVILDQFAQEREFHGGGPDEGWPLWCANQAGGTDHKILIIASPGWFRRYEGKEISGTGLGAAAEADVIRQRLVNAGGINPDIRIVAFDALNAGEVPLDLQRLPSLPRSGGLRQPRRLAHRHRARAAADWPDAPPALDWPVADHGPVRDAFGPLLTRAAP
jgi:hypothetical protein